jgi:hypothetical protein
MNRTNRIINAIKEIAARETLHLAGLLVLLGVALAFEVTGSARIVHEELSGQISFIILSLPIISINTLPSNNRAYWKTISPFVTHLHPRVFIYARCLVVSRMCLISGFAILVLKLYYFLKAIALISMVLISMTARYISCVRRGTDEAQCIYCSDGSSLEDDRKAIAYTGLNCLIKAFGVKRAESIFEKSFLGDFVSDSRGQKKRDLVPYAILTCLDYLGCVSRITKAHFRRLGLHIFVEKPRRSTTAPAFFVSICKPIQQNCIFQTLETHPSRKRKFNEAKLLILGHNL